MSFYECVLIARQDVSAPQVEALADTFTKVIEDTGGQVTKREHWGLRTLTFRIKKNRKGHYVFLNIDAPASAIHEMERQMRLSEDILRHMVVRVEKLEEGPSPMLQSRAGRDDRGGRRDDRGPRRDDRGGRDDRGRDDRGRDDRGRDDRGRDDRGRGEDRSRQAEAGSGGRG